MEISIDEIMRGSACRKEQLNENGFVYFGSCGSGNGSTSVYKNEKLRLLCFFQENGQALSLTSHLRYGSGNGIHRNSRD